MAVWGSSFAILRSLLGDGAASPLALVAVRMAIASALLLGFMAASSKGRAQLRSLRGELLRDGVFVGALLGIGFVMQIEGLQRTTASRSGFLTGTLVVLVPLIELAVFRKRPALPAAIGVLLAFVGMTVLSAGTGREAISTIESTPDLAIVLMDIMMPEMDGYETMQVIRQNPSLRRLPIIALTAKAMKGDREKCLEAGASEYLAKPVNTEQLLSALRMWLHR